MKVEFPTKIRDLGRVTIPIRIREKYRLKKNMDIDVLLTIRD